MIIQKVESFDASKLNKVEPAEKSILIQEKAIIGAAAYDHEKLNHVEPVEKTVMPSADGKYCN